MGENYVPQFQIAQHVKDFRRTRSEVSALHHRLAY